ncbi:protein RALF-like 33 [Curcuma longa]|uniref:protein RALF-like 33 n=1 Tax=Curcuma longa TaxID=136217 RepID=UPI003D9EF8A7
MAETPTEMAKRKTNPLTAWLLFPVATITPSVRAVVVGGGWIPSLSGCRGTVVECLAENEFNLRFKASHRVLITSDYIGYKALRRDCVPCSRRGASYHNGLPGDQANPYSCSCSTIT